MQQPSGSAKASQPRAVARIYFSSCSPNPFFLHLNTVPPSQSLQMAEILGVVASGMGVASLAMQVASSVKDFCDLVKDTPSNICDTLDDTKFFPSLLKRSR
jgi:hypothetical protein